MPRRPGRPPFDAVADLYDRVRPGYPASAVDDLVELAHLPRRGRVLEIGAGTGQLSVDLAERGHRLTAVEIGPHLAERLRASLAPYDAEVVCGDFHEVALTERSFDLVVAATSFHWLDRDRAYDRATRLLRPTGALALLFNVAVDVDQGYFGEAAAIYREHAPAIHDASWTSFDAIDWPAELGATGSLGPVQTSSHRWSATYTRRAYLDLLSTYSDHLALDPDARDRLLDALGTLIDDRYGGRVEQHYETRLYVAPVRADGTA